MENKNLFEIRNLTCSYDNKKKVLEVKKLDIERGKLIVVLGSSGAGKSTILETLGLMNETINKGSEVHFYPENNGKYDNFYNLWVEKEKDIVYNLRNKHFSFIFQNTNLMPNFSAYENICITQLLQGNTLFKSIKKAKKIMNELNLEKININKKTYELSGGEKQRIAFVRAITPEFTVLFGDEPTGNLDINNSNKLMKLLKKNLLDNKKTAIIVTHHIDMALNFADKIIFITKAVNSNKKDDYSEIIEENIFDSINGENGKKIWKNHKGNERINISEQLKNLMKNENES
jgi:lipoprotein-releasing system ATP-binding protein